MSSSFKSAFQDFYKDEYQLFFDKYSQSDAGQSDIVLIYSMDDLPDFKYTKYYLRYNYSFAEKFVIRNRWWKTLAWSLIKTMLRQRLFLPNYEHSTLQRVKACYIH